MKTAFSQYPRPVLPETSPDPIGFFEAVALAGLEGEFVRISAAQQRRHFGNVPFGRLARKVAKDGLVTVIRSCDFGSDFDTQEGRFDHAGKAWVSSDFSRTFRNNVFPR